MPVEFNFVKIRIQSDLISGKVAILKGKILILSKFANMKVYKFGGASVKDAEGIRNLGAILKGEDENLVVVVSALGKTTNALENMLKAWLAGDELWSNHFQNIKTDHFSILEELFGSHDEIALSVEASFRLLKDYLESTSPGEFDFEYDQVVSFGEIWSTRIVSGYMQNINIKVKWIDIRKCLITDESYRDANVLWDVTTEKVREAFDLSGGYTLVTQGFIGGTTEGNTTTLGREGSDYTAAILGNILNADRVVFWKDVTGILNADPKWMSDATRLAELSYKEAVEMTFSGAKVIHPKTIKPLHNKGIPLFVKSFNEPGNAGTVIKAVSRSKDSVPVYIKKEDQILISILPKDFSFAMGDNLSRVFRSFLENGIKVNLVQASAVSINVCVDNDRTRFDLLIEDLKKEYKTIYNDNAEIITVRHYTPEAIEAMTRGREVLLEQRTRKIVRFVLK